MNIRKLLSVPLAGVIAAVAGIGIAHAQVYITTAASAGSSNYTTLPAPGYSPTTTGIPSFLSTPDLSVGSRGGFVTDLQSILAELGYMAPPPAYGYFGPLTKAAVVAYQRATSLPATGYFGTLTKTGLAGLTESIETRALGVNANNGGVSVVVTSSNPGPNGLPAPLTPTGYWYNGSWYASVPASGTAGVNGYWVNGVWTPTQNESVSAQANGTTSNSAASSNGVNTSSTYGISTSHVNR